MSKIKAGDWVEVLSKEEILATLDKGGRLEGMPFMPQMFQYCGGRFQVYKRAHKTCDTIVYNWDSPGRHLVDGIHLNLRCDGKVYGGCEAACLIYWKEAWLKPVDEVVGSVLPRPLQRGGGAGCTEADVLRATRAEDLRGAGEPRYACQATQVLDFTTPLPWWDVRQYVEDYTSGNATLGEIARGFLWSLYYNATLARSRTLGGPARYLYDRFQALWGGLPYPRHHGEIPAGQETPIASLDLKPGELVRIKSYEEILSTLTTRNKNAGMSFDGEQVPYCGGIFRVRGRVETFIDEKTGYIRKMKTPAVTLEGVFCRARYSDYRLFCPRSIFSWWREIWLERVFEQPRPNIVEEQDGLAPVELVAMAAKAPARERVPITYSRTRLAFAEGASTNPLITIAIPTYNRAEMAEACARSALAQTYRNVEVLVSDNASTDDTVARLKAIGDERLRVLTSEENVGATGNFNKCVREARGDYLVLAADDNAFDPSFLEKCVALLNVEPELPIVLSAYDVLVVNEFSDDDRRVVPARLSRRLSTGVWQGTDILREYLNGRVSAQLLSSLIRTDILRRNGGYSAHPCAADEATWIPALLEGRAGLVNERCATYMVHGGSLSERASADERLGDLYQVMEEVSALAEKKVKDPAARRQIQSLTMRYVAYIAMINLVIYRRAGASLADVAQQFWRWRALIGRCTLMDFVTTLRLRSLGRILLPTPLARWSVRLGLDRLL